MTIKLFLTLLFCFICSVAYATEVTYYFDAYDSGEAWDTKPEDMVDGTTDTFALSGGIGDIELCNGNTCLGTDLGIITKVEIRIYAAAIQEGYDYIYLRPVFSGGDGDNHDVGSLSYDGEWSSYYDITSDTNAPANWTWTDIQNLDCDVEDYQDGGLSTTFASKVEIRVTYTAGVAARRIILIQ